MTRRPGASGFERQLARQQRMAPGGRMSSESPTKYGFAVRPPLVGGASISTWSVTLQPDAIGNWPGHANGPLFIGGAGNDTLRDGSDLTYITLQDQGYLAQATFESSVPEGVPEGATVTSAILSIRAKSDVPWGEPNFILCEDLTDFFGAPYYGDDSICTPDEGPLTTAWSNFTWSAGWESFPLRSAVIAGTIQLGVQSAIGFGNDTSWHISAVSLTLGGPL